MTSWSSLREYCRCRQFTLAEIEKATDSFSEDNFLGGGGEGMVYKGVIADASHFAIAVKRLKKRNSGDRKLESFRNEIKMFSKLHHANLVSLIGYCQESDENLLVYELISNGNLRNKLNNIACPLSYEQRVIICIGVARAIEYLHTGTSLNSKIIHRDIKPENILLTDNLEAKVSDFGLARIVAVNQTNSAVTTRHICGTPGYYAPEYYLTGHFTRKVDVYAFGLVLVEVLCNKKPPQNCKGSWRRFMKWVVGKVDPVMKKEISLNSLVKYISVAKKCLNKDPCKRPNMNQVVAMLDSALEAQTNGDGQRIKSGTNGKKRQIDSESSISNFTRNEPAKYQKISSSDEYSESSSSASVKFESTWQVSDAAESSGEVECSSQKSYKYPAGQESEDSDGEEMSSEKDVTYTSSDSSPVTLFPDIPSTQDKVVLYYDYGRDTTDYMTTLAYLGKYVADIEVRDPTNNKEFETQLNQFFTKSYKEFSLPQLFIGGKNIGGAKEVAQLFESGKLGQYFGSESH